MDDRERNAAIAEAATSWSQAYPGKKDVPRIIAKTCRAAMKLARNRGKTPAECLEQACEINRIDMDEVEMHLKKLTGEVRT